MATNRTMLMAMGKLGKGAAPADDEEEAPAKRAPMASESDEEDEGEEPDDKKQAFIDMCKAIKAGDFEKAWELYQDCEGM